MGQKLNVMGIIRLVIYILSALVGLAAVVVNAVGMGELATVLGTAAGAVAAITGGTASYNLPKAPDQKLGGFQVEEFLPAIREIAAAANTYRGAVDYEPRHSAEASAALVETAEEAASAAVDTASYAASVRGD